MIPSRVEQTTTSSGTGTITLIAPNNPLRQSFLAGLGASGKPVWYVIESAEGVTPAQWEEGYGVITAGASDTLTRSAVSRSSNGNALVDLAVGTIKNVFVSDNPELLRWGGAAPIVTSGGSALAHTVSYNPTCRAVTSGMRFSFRMGFANTGGNFTFSPDGLGPFNVRRSDGTNFSPLEVPADDIMDIVYDGTNFRRVNSTSGANNYWVTHPGLLSNPYFDINQATPAGAINLVSGTIQYCTDETTVLQTATTLVTSAAIVTSGVFSGSSGFRRLVAGIDFRVQTAKASLTASELVIPMNKPVEGLMMRSLGWGTADARAVLVAFVVQASLVAGSYAVNIRNAAGTRSYVTMVTLGLNQPSLVVVRIPGDTSGTWLDTTAFSAQVTIGAVAGTTYQIASLDTWTAGNFFSHSSAAAWQATVNHNLRFAMVDMFPEGALPIAPGVYTSTQINTNEALQKLFSVKRPVDQEYMRCCRYFFVGDVQSIISGAMISGISHSQYKEMKFPVSMRTAPTMAGSFVAGFNNTTATFVSSSPNYFTWQVTASGLSTANFAATLDTGWTANARML